MIVISEGWITTAKELAEEEIAGTESVYAYLYENNKLELMTYNAYVCADAAVLRGMLAYRVDHDIKGAHGFFNVGASLAVELAVAVERYADDNSLSDKEIVFTAGMFVLPIYVCLLAGRFDLANKLSQAITSPVVFTTTEDVDHVETNILAATVRDDVEAADVLDERYRQMAADELASEELIFSPYIQLCRDIRNSDAKSFRATLNMVETRFSERAHSKLFDDGKPILGGPGYNDVVVDFMACGLIKLAIERGMDVDVDSVYLPAALTGSSVSVS